MAEVEQAVFHRLRSVVAADTGSGGLMNTTGHQHLRGNLAVGDPAAVGGAFRHGDPNVRDMDGEINQAHPCLVIAVEASERSASPAAASPNKKLYDAVCHLFVFADRDVDGLAQVNAVQARLYAVLDNVVMSSIADSTFTSGSTLTWTFAPLGRVGRPRFFDTGKENRIVISYRVVVTRA